MQHSSAHSTQYCASTPLHHSERLNALAARLGATPPEHPLSPTRPRTSRQDKTTLTSQLRSLLSISLLNSLSTTALFLLPLADLLSYLEQTCASTPVHCTYCTSTCHSVHVVEKSRPRRRGLARLSNIFTHTDTDRRTPVKIILNKSSVTPVPALLVSPSHRKFSEQLVQTRLSSLCVILCFTWNSYTKDTNLISAIVSKLLTFLDINI